jgi:hypothetical protein
MITMRIIRTVNGRHTSLRVAHEGLQSSQTPKQKRFLSPSIHSLSQPKTTNMRNSPLPPPLPPIHVPRTTLDLIHNRVVPVITCRCRLRTVFVSPHHVLNPPISQSSKEEGMARTSTTRTSNQTPAFQRSNSGTEPRCIRCQKA